MHAVSGNRHTEIHCWPFLRTTSVAINHTNARQDKFSAWPFQWNYKRIPATYTCQVRTASATFGSGRQPGVWSQRRTSWRHLLCLLRRSEQEWGLLRVSSGRKDWLFKNGSRIPNGRGEIPTCNWTRSQHRERERSKGECDAKELWFREVFSLWVEPFGSISSLVSARTTVSWWSKHRNEFYRRERRRIIPGVLIALIRKGDWYKYMQSPHKKTTTKRRKPHACTWKMPCCCRTQGIARLVCCHARPPPRRAATSRWRHPWAGFEALQLATRLREDEVVWRSVCSLITADLLLKEIRIHLKEKRKVSMFP